jgi:hypothetical protein
VRCCRCWFRKVDVGSPRCLHLFGWRARDARGCANAVKASNEGFLKLLALADCALQPDCRYELRWPTPFWYMAAYHVFGLLW